MKINLCTLLFNNITNGLLSQQVDCADLTHCMFISVHLIISIIGLEKD